MVEVTERSANWRLFGGGGLLVGGLLLLLAALLPFAGTPVAVTFWLGVVGILLVGIALFFVAFGQTGSNGAVGASTWGKLVLVLAGIAAIVTALIAVLGNFGVTALAVGLAVRRDRVRRSAVALGGGDLRTRRGQGHRQVDPVPARRLGRHRR